MHKLKSFVVETFKCWKTDNALSAGAALSFYTIIAFPALILSLLFITGLFLEKETVQAQILYQAEIFFGGQGKNLVEQIIANVPPPAQLRVASVVSILILLFGAMGFFEQLQTAINKIWNVTPKDLGWKGFFKNKLMVFVMVIGLGGLLVGTLMIEFFLSFILPYFQALIPVSVNLVQWIGFVLSFVIITLVFALIYKYIPHVKIAWRDVWVGAIVTAVLFTFGKYVIGFYLSKSSVGSAYGAAGSLVLFLVWVYYSSQAIFLGAEFTQNYANTYGSKIKPNAQALRTDSLWNKLFRKV